ncbi:MAG: hypothetical protein ACYTG0_33835, partial [Planctomycetota bacterium]
SNAYGADEGPLAVGPRGGEVLRIPAFDLRRPAAEWTAGRLFEHQKGDDGVGFYGINRTSFSANTVRLKPNRSYLLSVLLQADFERPTEVNMGLRTFDAGGKNVIDNLIGLPNKTNGWERFEWVFTTDPRATHGRLHAHFYDFTKDGTLRIGDVAFVELPPKGVKPYGRGEGVTFRGGPGRLPMRVEEARQQGDRIVVRTTGSLYTFDLKRNRLSARQMLQRERDIAEWRFSMSLAGLEILSRENSVCVLGNENVTIGVQCDSLVMIVPHDELILTLTSRIGGRWNRLACGHLTSIDDFGGIAVNPDIPLGSGRLARCDAGVRPGRVVAGKLDFSGISDNQTFLSRAEPGWQVKWYTSPGERIAVSVFPPRPYPWKESFHSHWRLIHRSTPLAQYKQHAEVAEIALLWNFIQRSWGMSWGPEFTPHDEDELRGAIAAAKEAGMRPIVYISPYFYYSRDPAEFTEHARRLKEKYGIDGAYYDGIPSQEWVVAYEEMRMTRELFRDGVIIVHTTGHASNGGPPLGEPSLKIPAVETYADVTYAGELVFGEGRDWAYPKYIPSQYRKANCVGVMKHDKWEGLTPRQRDLTMLLHNGRAKDRQQYGPILDELEKLWEEKGDEPEFYEKRWLPAVRRLTTGILPE